jgi:hypothetical protein
LSKELEGVTLKDKKLAGDITGNEEEGEDDILGLLNIDTGNEQNARTKEDLEFENMISKKRKFEQISSEEIQLPKREIKDKRYKYDLGEEDLMEISRLVNQSSNANLHHFEDIIIDLDAAPMEIENYEDVYRNRNNYTKYYSLALIDMMRHEIVEDYNNKKVKELPLVKASLEHIEKKAKSKTGIFDRKIKNLKAQSREKRKKYAKNLKQKTKKLMEKRKKKLSKKLYNKENGIKTESEDDSDPDSEIERGEDIEEAEYGKEENYRPPKPKRLKKNASENSSQNDEKDTIDDKDPSKSTDCSSLIPVDPSNSKADIETKEEQEDEEDDPLDLDEEDVKEAMGDLSEEETENEDAEEPSSDDEKDYSKDVFFLTIEENEYPPELRKDAQKADLWLFMKERMNTTQSLKEINDFIFIKTCWHGLGKSKKIKVKVVGNKSDVISKLKEYKYALRSINVGQYENLINNLIVFRDALPNKYLDSVLHINNTNFFEPLMKIEEEKVLEIKKYFSKQFNLNMDQD